MTAGDLKRLLPTAEELELAQNQIEADGPAAPFTVALGTVVHTDSAIQRVIRRMLPANLLLGVSSIEGTIERAALQGAYLAGLNLGLRIGELRNKRQAPLSSD